MKLAQSQVLKLSQVDERVLELLEKKGVLKANQLATLLGISRQSVAYRLRSLERRGFVKYVDGKGWQVGTYWKRGKEEMKSGVEVIAGLETIVNRVEKLLTEKNVHSVYAVENVYYKSLSEKEKLAWKKMDKRIDEIFVQKGVLVRAVGNSESYRIFIESQEMHKDTIKSDRKVIYKILPEDILRLPYEEACTLCVIDDLVLHFYFKTETVEIFQNKVYANLIAKYFNLAEQYGRQVDVNAELRKLKD